LKNKRKPSRGHSAGLFWFNYPHDGAWFYLAEAREGVPRPGALIDTGTNGVDFL
jgi:hypothetical protein